MSKELLGQKIFGPNGLTRGGSRVIVGGAVGGGGTSVPVFVPNLRLLGYFLLVFFGGGCSSCSCCCSCDRGKSKSTPSPWTWNWSFTTMNHDILGLH